MRVPKRSLARCDTVFWGVSPGAKQGLHGARDLFGTPTPEARKHLSHSPRSTFGHFGCFDTCARPAGSQQSCVANQSALDRGQISGPSSCRVDFRFSDAVFHYKRCDPGCLLQGPETTKVPKVVKERVQKVFWTQGAKVLLLWCKRELHRCKTGFRWCKRLLGDLCSLGPKHLLHPLLTILGTFEVSGPCSRHSGSYYMLGFCRDVVVNFAVDFSVDFLSFVKRDGRPQEVSHKEITHKNP